MGVANLLPRAMEAFHANSENVYVCELKGRRPDPDRLATEAFRTKSDDVPVWRRVEMRPKHAFRINSDDVPVHLNKILSGNEAFRANSVDVSTVGSVRTLRKTHLGAHDS